MNSIQLSIKNIIAKPLSTGLSLILLSLGVGLISLMLQLEKQLERQVAHNSKGIDMVVGAKGSPLQLILSAIFQIDVPTGNIQLSEAEALQRNRLVEYGIPLSYGDSYELFRIVGTTSDYPELYSMKLSEGDLWQKSLEVTLGSQVAERTGLKIGDTFFGSHGLSEGGHVHEDRAYVVRGIFAPSATVVDQLILTGLESVWDIHEHSDPVDSASHLEDSETHPHVDNRENEKSTANEKHLFANSEEHEQKEDHQHEDEEQREITAMLIKFRNPMGLVQLPRMVNEKTNMQAALPNYELSKLFSLMGVAIKTLNIVAIVVMLVSGISVFISLYLSLNQRTYEMALLRTYGASRSQLLGMIVQEGLLISFVGFLCGLVSSRIGFFIISQLITSGFHYDLADAALVREEGFLLLISLFIGFFAALIPALRVFRINLSKTLADA